jgi:hypothetical protein
MFLVTPPKLSGKWFVQSRKGSILLSPAGASVANRASLLSLLHDMWRALNLIYLC